MRRHTATLSAGVKLAVFTVVTVTATALLATTIGSFGFGGHRRTFHAVFTDVTGLQRGDDVRIAGVRVGTVDGISVTHRTQARVTFSLTGDEVVPGSVRAVLKYRNLVGQRYLALQQGPGTAAPLPDNGTIPVSQTAPALDLTVLFDGFKPLFAALSPDDVNTFATEVISVLQGEGPGIDDLLARTASLTSTIADRDALVGRTIDDLDAVLATVDQRDTQVSDLVLQLQRLVSGLSADRAAIGGSLTGIAGLTEQTADLLDKTRPALQADVAGVRALAGNLAASNPTVDRFLKTLPGKLSKVTRTATYGAWFNFYLCDFDGRIALPAGVTYTPTLAVSAGRCAP